MGETERDRMLENFQNKGTNVTLAPFWRAPSAVMRFSCWVFSLVNGPRLGVGGPWLKGNNLPFPSPWLRTASSLLNIDTDPYAGAGGSEATQARAPWDSFFLLKVTHWIRASLVAQLVKNLPAVQETWVLSLDWEDPLEKGKAPHSSILTWRIPWTL